jgi:hypothetical protein
MIGLVVVQRGQLKVEPSGLPDVVFELGKQSASFILERGYYKSTVSILRLRASLNEHASGLRLRNTIKKAQGPRAFLAIGPDSQWKLFQDGIHSNMIILPCKTVIRR